MCYVGGKHENKSASNRLGLYCFKVCLSLSWAFNEIQGTSRNFILIPKILFFTQGFLVTESPNFGEFGNLF